MRRERARSSAGRTCFAFLLEPVRIPKHRGAADRRVRYPLPIPAALSLNIRTTTFARSFMTSNFFLSADNLSQLGHRAVSLRVVGVFPFVLPGSNETLTL